MDTPVVRVSLAQLASDVKEPPPCRCEFVHKWLDEHLKYFPPPPTPRVITRLCGYTYGPAPLHYFYSQPLKSVQPPSNVQLPFIVPAPHRISPLRLTYH